MASAEPANRLTLKALARSKKASTLSGTDLFNVSSDPETLSAPADPAYAALA